MRHCLYFDVINPFEIDKIKTVENFTSKMETEMENFQ